MNPAHRDRLAFLRICSGTFERGMNVTLSRTGKQLKLSQSTQLMANERETVEKAYAGDVIGIYDTGNYQIGDTLTTSKEKIFFEPLPTFPPEFFKRVHPVNSLKSKNNFKKAFHSWLKKVQYKFITMSIMILYLVQWVCFNLRCLNIVLK